jgi:hypothetical protein
LILNFCKVDCFFALIILGLCGFKTMFCLRTLLTCGSQFWFNPDGTITVTKLVGMAFEAAAAMINSLFLVMHWNNVTLLQVKLKNPKRIFHAACF